MSKLTKFKLSELFAGQYEVDEYANYGNSLFTVRTKAGEHLVNIVQENDILKIMQVDNSGLSCLTKNYLDEVLDYVTSHEGA